MDHIACVAFEAASPQQVEYLHRARPNGPNRTQVIQRLIWEARTTIAYKFVASAAAR